MKDKEKLEVIKHIKLGTSEVLYYPYNEGSEPLPLRPISSFEFDQCFYNSLQKAPAKIADLVIKLRLKLIDKERDITVSDEGYASLLLFYDQIDYWVVYYAMKDFQDSKFSYVNFDDTFLRPNGYFTVLKMNDVHEISEFVMNASFQPKEVIKEVLTDESGKEVGYIVYFLKQPLAEIKDMTRLQRDYLLYSKGEVYKASASKDKEKSYLISGQKMTIGELLKRFGR